MYFKFTDYAPFVFQRIRMRRNISEEEYMKSLGPEQILNCFWTGNFESLYELCSSGQSGALFYFSKDKQYMLKTIPKREFQSLRTILANYLSHVNKYPDSMITTFFGMHKIEWGTEGTCSKKETRYLIVMGNLFKDWIVGNRFDMKGSTQGRTYLKGNRKYDDLTTRNRQTAMKDNDFRKHVGKLEFVEQFSLERSLLEKLFVDANFLAANNLIDYSLIIGEIEVESINSLKQ